MKLERFTLKLLLNQVFLKGAFKKGKVFYLYISSKLHKVKISGLKFIINLSFNINGFGT